MTSRRPWLAGALLSAALLIGAPGAFAAAAPPDTLARIRQASTIRIAYREDAPPFSYLDKTDQPVGFMVDLCRAVAKDIGSQLGRPLKVTYVPVSATDRFAAIEQGKADMLCEATTETLTRREVVDFSLPTFVDGAGILIPVGGPENLQALAGKKVGVLAGTTTERELHAALKSNRVVADVIPVKSHSAGLAMLDSGQLSAYFADRAILAFLITTSKAPGKLLLANNYLTIEPYALALPRGDEDFRLAVDRALSHIYRSGDIRAIFQQAFGTQAQAGAALQALYLITGLPD